MVERIRNYLIEESSEENRWFSTTDIAKWLETDKCIRNALLERRQRMIRCYRLPAYLTFEEHALTLRRY